MKKTIKRILAGMLLTILVMISGVVTIIFFPQPLFANKIEHNNFNVYSNDKIDQDMKAILDNALGRVKKSELYDPAYTYDIFLAYNSLFNRIDDKILGYGPSARATDNNIVFKVDVDPGRNVAFPTFYEKCEADLTYLIAHEMIHCLQENKYGKLKFNPFRHPEYWKLEGYPEYIARQPKPQGADLVADIERYIDLESKLTDIWISSQDGGCKVPKYYYKSRLMTTYLIDIKDISYDSLLNDTISEDKVFADMVKWKDENHNH